MTAKVILNPYAGRWKAQEQRSNAEAALRAVGIDYDLSVTDGPGHAIELAAEAAKKGFSPVIAAGGDGTISEVVNGLHAVVPPGESIGPFGLLPMGSANDLAHNLKMPLELSQVADLIAQGRARKIDLGQIIYVSPDHQQRQRCFVNNAALGLEPTITVIQSRMKHLRGTLRYLAAAVKGIFSKCNWNVQMEWEGGSYRGPMTLVSVGNGAITGGLFYMAPHADLGDGQFTLVHGHVSGSLALLRLLPATMKSGSGSYIEHPAFCELNSSWLRIQMEPASPFHSDGEILSEGVQDVEFRIIPQRLEIIA